MNKGYSKTPPKKAPKSVLKGYANLGKKNVLGKTGFNSVASKTAKQYGSRGTVTGQKVAGAVLAQMRTSGKA